MRYTIRIVLQLFFIICLIVFNFACERIIDTEYDYVYDFMHRFKEAEIKPSEQEVFLVYGWDNEPGPRDALVTLAIPGKSSATYFLPADRKGDRLYFGYGMTWGRATGAIVVEVVPRPVENTVTIRDTVFIRSLAPTDNVERDSRWFEGEEVDLSRYRGMDIKITFEAEASARRDRWGWLTPVLKY